MDTLTFQQRLIPKRELRRKRWLALTLFLATAVVGFLCVSLLKSTTPDEPVSSVGGIVLTALGTLLIIPFGFLLPLLSALFSMVWWLEATSDPARQTTVRFSRSGWSATRPGKKEKDVEWWPTTAVSITRRKRSDRVNISIKRARSTLQTFNTIIADFHPPAGMTLSEVRSQIAAWKAEACGTAIPTAESIIHCPACGYRLDVPDKLPRPGRCPECGWAFDQETLVLRGDAGPTYRRVNIVATRTTRRELLTTLFGGVVFLAAIVVFNITSQSVFRQFDRLAPSIQRVLEAGLIVGVLLLMVWVVLQVSRKGGTDLEKRNRKLAAADTAVSTAGVIVTSNGFRQFSHRPNWVIDDRRTSIIPWGDWHARLIRTTDGQSRLWVERPAQTSMARRLRRAEMWYPKLSWFIRRPVDILLPLGRREHHELRRRLRELVAAG